MLTLIAVLVSGGGTNLQALIDAQKSGALSSGEIALVVSNKPDVYALTRARENSIPSVVIEGAACTQAEFEERLSDVLHEHGIELIVLAGFMRILSGDFTQKWPRRILNVHPSLIPAFCGKGYYGLRVHEAALNYGVKVTGATVHFVNEIPDGGRIIMQKAVYIKEDDTPETLQQRVMREAEWQLLPAATELVAREILEEKLNRAKGLVKGMNVNVYEIDSIASRLRGNSYVGRGIVIGMSADGRSAVIAYFIMGRSANSRNRVFEEQGDNVVIRPFDADKVQDPSLIIYSPVRKQGDWLVVTNGDQTDTICDFLSKGRSFEEALETREFEPDAPNFTPRISGILYFSRGSFSYKMNILKSADASGSACLRQTFSYPALPGLGHFLHTYVCDGDPLPSFQGEPERVSIPNDIDAFASELWSSLNEQNRVSLYVRYTDLRDGRVESRLINKNKQEVPM